MLSILPFLYWAILKSSLNFTLIVSTCQNASLYQQIKLQSGYGSLTTVKHGGLRVRVTQVIMIIQGHSEFKSDK